MSQPPAPDAFDAFVKKAGGSPKPPPGLRDRIRARLDAADAEMGADLERQELHAFLDRQLPPERAAKVEAKLSQDPKAAQAAEEERAFLALVKKASARSSAPPGFRERLAAKLNATELDAQPAEAAQAGAPATLEAQRTPPPERARVVRGFFGSRARILASSLAASVLAVVGLYVYFTRMAECPYMLGCVEQHRAILEGKEKLAVAQGDPEAIAAFVREKAEKNLGALPDFSRFNLAPAGAGVASFSNLPSDWKAPQGAFVKLTGAQGEVATLIFHPWIEEEPMETNLKLIDGKKFWLMDHQGYRAASWKLCDGVLCTFISKRSMDDVRKLAVDVCNQIQLRTVRAPLRTNTRETLLCRAP
ncbi:MAG: hypothetical protein HY291_13885 [Planctomycetes bacterium]|nr:hypothetical protein [Planctomycetota bacterium]